MNDQPTREQQLLHLVDRARRGVALPAEHDALAAGVSAMADRADIAENELRTLRAGLRANGAVAALLYLLDQPQQPTTTEADGPRCVCGDQIQLREEIDPNSWVHGPDSDTPCWNARPAQQPTA